MPQTQPYIVVPRLPESRFEDENQTRRILESWMTEVADAINRAISISGTALLSGTFAIDSTGVRTVTTAHGFRTAPAVEDIQLTTVEETDVDDWAYNLLKIESVDATNVVAKINVSTASATGSSTARLAILIRGN